MHAHASPALAKRRAAPAAAKRGRPPSPSESLLTGDSGSRATSLLGLQRSSGNRAVAQLVRTYDGDGKAPSIHLHGQATPFYDGGTAKVLNTNIKRERGCDCPQDEPCMTGNGTLQVSYKVDVTVVMPEVPSGLTACQEGRVRTFLRDVLGPHEQAHVRRLRSYDGTTNRPFTVTACGRQALDEAVNTKIQRMQEDEHNQRSADADTKSAAIDPFDRPIDLDC